MTPKRHNWSIRPKFHKLMYNTLSTAVQKQKHSACLPDNKPAGWTTFFATNYNT